MVLHRQLSILIPIEIYNSRNFVWFYTKKANGCTIDGIYNSRNFVWFYTIR